MDPVVEDLATATAEAMEAEAAATEHRLDPMEMHHPLATAFPTCISKLRMAAVTHSRSLSTACLRKVFQNQTLPMFTAVAIRFEPMLTVS